MAEIVGNKAKEMFVFRNIWRALLEQSFLIWKK